MKSFLGVFSVLLLTVSMLFSLSGCGEIQSEDLNLGNSYKSMDLELNGLEDPGIQPLLRDRWYCKHDQGDGKDYVECSGDSCGGHDYDDVDNPMSDGYCGCQGQPMKYCKTPNQQ